MKHQITSIFWTTVVISFVLLVHNGTEPLFLLAYALLGILIPLFLFKKTLWPFVFYLLIIGALGRYTRYFRETYASDVLLATRDYIGYLLAGKNVYKELVMTGNGPIPFSYFPFDLFWYLPAQLLAIDLRFLEMIISSIVPLALFFYGWLKKNWNVLPVLAVVSLTPFLLDLSSDGSNDNSAIFLLLLAVNFFIISMKTKKKRWAVISAVVMGLAFSFKQYLAIFALFFVPYVFFTKKLLPISHKKYFLILALTAGLVSLPFVIASPAGFWRSVFFIEVGNFQRTTWGWNIWVALRDGLGIEFTKEQMRLVWFVRTGVVGATVFGLWKFFRLQRLGRVYIATGLTLLIYFALSNWTTYAYFTFLVPIFALAAIEKT